MLPRNSPILSTGFRSSAQRRCQSFVPSPAKRGRVREGASRCRQHQYRPHLMERRLPRQTASPIIRYLHAFAGAHGTRTHPLTTFRSNGSCEYSARRSSGPLGICPRLRGRDCRCAPAPAHVLDGRSNAFQLADMPMDAGMIWGMLLIVAGIGVAGYGLLPKGRTASPQADVPLSISGPKTLRLSWRTGV